MNECIPWAIQWRFKLRDEEEAGKYQSGHKGKSLASKKLSRLLGNHYLLVGGRLVILRNSFGGIAKEQEKWPIVWFTKS